jgi:hypothetical protein
MLIQGLLLLKLGFSEFEKAQTAFLIRKKRLKFAAFFCERFSTHPQMYVFVTKIIILVTSSLSTCLVSSKPS